MSHALRYADDPICSCRQSALRQSRDNGLPGLIERFRQRRALRALNDRLLDDIGVSSDEANRECAGLLWRTYAQRHLK